MFGSSILTSFTTTNCGSMLVTPGWLQFYVSCVPSAQGAVQVSVANFIADMATPPNFDTGTIAGYVMYDSVKPTVSATYALSGNTITWTIVYSEAGQKPADDTLIVSGATCPTPSLSASGGDTFSCTFAEGSTITLNIAANSYCDDASNCNDQYSLTVLAADDTNPTVSAITAYDWSSSSAVLANNGYTNDNPIMFTFTVSENIANVDLTGFDAACNAATFSTGWQMVVVNCFPTSPATGTSITATIPDGMFADAAGNAVAGETETLTLTYDDTAPVIAVTAASSGAALATGDEVSAAVVFTLTLTEANPDPAYSLADVYWLSNCIETTPAVVTATTVTVTCDPTGFAGITSITVIANSYYDLAGNGNDPGAIFSVLFGGSVGLTGAINHLSVSQDADFEESTIQAIIDDIAASLDVAPEDVGVTDIADGVVHFIVSELCEDEGDDCLEHVVDELRMVSRSEPVVSRHENSNRASSPDVSSSDDDDSWIGALLIGLSVAVVMLSIIVVTMLCRLSPRHATPAIQLVQSPHANRSSVVTATRPCDF